MARTNFPDLVVHYLEAELFDLFRTDEKVFTFLQEGSLDGLWYWDLENPEHEYLSPQFWQLLGHDPADMPHRADAWQDMINPDDRKVALANFEAHLVDPNHAYDQTVRYRHADGSEITVRCRGIAIRDADGKPTRMLGVHTDLTALKQGEERLRTANELLASRIDQVEAANEAKNQFLANMSHEIRTPLNGVIGLASALSNTTLDNRQAGMLEAMQAAGAQLLSLVEEILELSQIETGHARLHETKVDLVSLASDVVLLHKRAAEEAGLKLALESSALPKGLVMADARRVRQVLENLISNALKFTPNGGVHVALSGEYDRATDQLLAAISVADSGPGVPDTLKHEIFDRFSQRREDGVDIKSNQGLGLGLTLSRSICRLLGGDLTVADTIGGGATFTARLRFAVVETPETQPLTTAADLEEFAPLSLLVAEDNMLNRFVIESFLEETSIELDFVGDGEEALEALAARNYDAALIDMRMPVMDGLAFKSAYDGQVSEGKLRTIPMATYSANAMPDQVAAAKNAGFVHHLAKPISFESLSDCLRKLKEPA